MRVVATNVKQGALLGGWLIFALSVVLLLLAYAVVFYFVPWATSNAAFPTSVQDMYATRGTFVGILVAAIAVILQTTSFILGIVALSQKRISGGIALTISSLLPLTLFLLVVVLKATESVHQEPSWSSVLQPQAPEATLSEQSKGIIIAKQKDAGGRILKVSTHSGKVYNVFTDPVLFDGLNIGDSYDLGETLITQ